MKLQPTTDEIYFEIGQRIIAGRRECGMSQEQLSAESGVDRSHIGFIEQGRRKPTLATLLKITRSLGISLEELLKGF